MDGCKACGSEFGTEETCANCGAYDNETDVDRIIRRLEEDVERLTGVIERARSIPPRVEVLVDIDDGQVTVHTWIDGARASSTVEVVEASPPHTGAEWMADTRQIASAGYSPDFTAAVTERLTRQVSARPMTKPAGEAARGLISG